MYEDEFEDEQDTLSSQDILTGAQVDWAANMPSFNLNASDIIEDINGKIKGFTVNQFKEACQEWYDAITSLRPFDEYKIRKEIDSWVLDLPDKDNYNLDSIFITYSNYVKYRNRLTYFIDIVHSSHELISQAQKYIKEMAGFVASGPKHDKDAIGSFYTNNLMIAVSESKRVLNYLESNLKNIEFNTQQLERMYRERVAISRINNTMLNEGLGLSFEMSTSSANISNSSKKEAEIKTFNYSGK